MAHRLKLEEVTCEVAPARTRARVQLRNSDIAHVGLASSHTEDAGSHHVVAQATANAIRMYAGFAGAEMRFAVDGVRILSDPRPLVVVAVTLGSEGKEQSLVGSVPIGDDPHRAVAKAVLQALNRQIERIMPADPRSPALT